MIYCKKLNIPLYNSQIKDVDGNDFIFDEFRKKWVRLTPEEWVRQQFLMYLHLHLNYPKHAIAVEKSINYNNLKKRIDAAIVGKNAKILMIIEFKKPDVVIDEKVFLQAATYSSVLGNMYFLLTNGITHIACSVDKDLKKISYLEQIPDYSVLKQM